MVALKNISINDKIAECDIYPENSKAPGHVVVDLVSGEYKYTLPLNYEYCTSHAGFAAERLKRKSTTKDLKDDVVMWY